MITLESNSVLPCFGFSLDLFYRSFLLPLRIFSWVFPLCYDGRLPSLLSCLTTSFAQVFWNVSWVLGSCHSCFFFCHGIFFPLSFTIFSISLHNVSILHILLYICMNTSSVYENLTSLVMMLEEQYGYKLDFGFGKRW